MDYADVDVLCHLLRDQLRSHFCLPVGITEDFLVKAWPGGVLIWLKSWKPCQATVHPTSHFFVAFDDMDFCDGSVSLLESVWRRLGRFYRNFAVLVR